MSRRRPSRSSTIPSAAELVPSAAKACGPTYPFGGAEPESGDVMAVAPAIRWVRIAVPGPLRHVNCWLLDDAGDVALVDTGMDGAASREAWRQVFRGPLAGTDVTCIIGTHFHPDHIGLAGWMAAHHDAPVVMTRGEWLTAQFLIADARDEVPDAAIAFWRGAGWDQAQLGGARERGWSFFRRLVTPMPISYRRIVDGDRLRIGHVDWRIVVGSGHSIEHACLLDEADGVLIAGDQVLPRISPNVSLGMFEPDADPLGEWLASIEKLRALPADLLVLPGHGDPFNGLHGRLDAIEEEHRDRLTVLHDFCAEPRRAVDCFPVLFHRTIGADILGMASGEALAHLRHLEVEGRVSRAVEDGVWWYSRTS